MKEFFEPMLFLSTPDHPNTMGAIAVLKEAVDGEILQVKRRLVLPLRLITKRYWETMTITAYSPTLWNWIFQEAGILMT